ncbi:hypothetical protein [Limosilactobacillus gastricus]|uniref:hypothetical protein n=1 Tax=Limosilactobacillus gastricus TaxID=227942 RepID=UPI00058E95DF|nr:hypothetical protein [Limosilactobacillus gastricus]
MDYGYNIQQAILSRAINLILARLIEILRLLVSYETIAPPAVNFAHWTTNPAVLLVKWVWYNKQNYFELLGGNS